MFIKDLDKKVPKHSLKINTFGCHGLYIFADVSVFQKDMNE